MNVLFSVGHSTHPVETFVKLLQMHGVTALVDVRSHPYSRHFPQFSRDALKDVLQRCGITYVFLGKELGARSENSACYRHGKVQFDLLAKEPLFAQGLDRVRQGMQKFQVALMCAEKDPLECHRAVLVARRLYESGTDVQHIHADGHLEDHHAMESRMLALHKMSEADMFRSRGEIVADAYIVHGERIAYQDDAMLKEETSEGFKQ
ncbi:MAG: DUF488 domain-containing protein [Comamonadaceae bacterium]|nr:MAG: DUF488 domain-containing protein [Comamonadaceae bacterium]